jgi:hypothetical protein
MNDVPVNPPMGHVPWAPAPDLQPAPRRRLLKLAVGIGAAAGVAVGATALAQAATSTGNGLAPSAATVTASSSTTTTVPKGARGFDGGGGRFRGGFGPAGGLGAPGGLGVGPVLYGQYTIKGPNGYETLSVRTGTVSDVTDTSGSTWSLTVKSADGTSGNFTVDSTSSVNGGEMGIGSVKSGDSVRVTAVVSGSTSTATQVIDETTLQANAKTWQPMGPMSGSGEGTATPSTQTQAPPV